MEAITSHLNVRQNHARLLVDKIVADFPTHTKLLYVAKENAGAIEAYTRLGWVLCANPATYANYAPDISLNGDVTYLCYKYGAA